MLTLLFLLILFGLIGSGILSASVLIGLHKKSFTTGFKTFLVSTSTVGGLVFGLLGFWVLHKTVHWWSLQTGLIAGSLSGILGGFLFGLLAFYVIQKFTFFLKEKIKTTT